MASASTSSSRPSAGGSSGGVPRAAARRASWRTASRVTAAVDSSRSARTSLATSTPVRWRCSARSRLSSSSSRRHTGHVAPASSRAARADSAASTRARRAACCWRMDSTRAREVVLHRGEGGGEGRARLRDEADRGCLVPEAFVPLPPRGRRRPLGGRGPGLVEGGPGLGVGGAGGLDRLGRGHRPLGGGGQLLLGRAQLLLRGRQLGPGRLEPLGQLAEHGLDLGHRPLEVVEGVGPAQVGAQVGLLRVPPQVLGEEGGAGHEPGVGRPRLLQQADRLPRGRRRGRRGWPSSPSSAGPPWPAGCGRRPAARWRRRP